MFTNDYKVVSKFNSEFIPSFFDKSNSDNYHREYYEGYSIIECRGKVSGYTWDYQSWFGDLEMSKSAKHLIGCVCDYASNDKTNDNFALCKLIQFREFLLRYSNGEFKTAQPRTSNRGPEPKEKYYNELSNTFRKNIVLMIEAISFAERNLTNTKAA